VCVFAWEERARESLVANREKVQEYLDKYGAKYGATYGVGRS
jgi:hypothetical protein